MGILKFMHVYHFFVYVCLQFGFHLKVGNHYIYLYKNEGLDGV